MNLSPRAATLAAFVAFSATVATTTSAFALPNPPDIIPAQGGPIKITPIYHASLQIEYRGFVIQVDPFSAGDYSGAKKADMILITHSHPDHYDLKAIGPLVKPNTYLVAPPSVTVQAIFDETKNHLSLLRGVRMLELSNGNSFLPTINAGNKRLTTTFRIDAVPMYNIVRGPKPGVKYHPKGQFNGYVLTMGGKRIYIAGDTEATPEMKALKNIDVAFIPMNLPYTMTPREAAEGVRAFKPKVVYPYHYRFPFNKPNDNPQQFQKALAGSGIEVRIRGWYAHPAGK